MNRVAVESRAELGDGVMMPVQAAPKGQHILPPMFQQALVALKDQAAAVVAQLEGKDRTKAKALLADAQRRMELHSFATRAISQVLLASHDESLTIDTLDEDRLVRELGPEYLSQFVDAYDDSPSGAEAVAER